MEDLVDWERDVRGKYALLLVSSRIFTSLICLITGPSTYNPRPPSEYDEDEDAELAALAEEEAYWEAFGDAGNLEDRVKISALEPGLPAVQSKDGDIDMDMDMS